MDFCSKSIKLYYTIKFNLSRNTEFEMQISFFADNCIKSLEMAATYCEYVDNKGKNTVHQHYHDKEYGFPLINDDQLFGRLVLEINQAGLSWETILKKKEHFFKVFDGFRIEKVARYSEAKKAKLLNDPGIIRNRLKVEAAIYNAGQILIIQKEYGSFLNWLDHHHPLTREEWVKLFKTRFRFTGGEIVNEFLMSTGYLPGAHVETCLIYKKVLKCKPRWATKKGNGKG